MRGIDSTNKERWENVKAQTDCAMADVGYWCLVADHMMDAIEEAELCSGRERVWARSRVLSTLDKLVDELRSYRDEIEVTLSGPGSKLKGDI